MPPTSIDGTDITGATIDGTDVTEITVDGQTVFTAQTLPVAYSNLVAWYPFDSATYGGSNADDVTAIIGGSGDDTAYDGTVNGASYQSSGGVTDINAGANSGAFDFGTNDNIATTWDFSGMSSYSYMFYLKPANLDSQDAFGQSSGGVPNTNATVGTFGTTDLFFEHYDSTGSASNTVGNGISMTAGQWKHVAATWDGSTFECFADGVSVTTFSVSSLGTSSLDVFIGSPDGNRDIDGTMDDVRIYDTALSGPQVSQIVSNTPHP